MGLGADIFPRMVLLQHEFSSRPGLNSLLEPKSRPELNSRPEPKSLPELNSLPAHLPPIGLDIRKLPTFTRTIHGSDMIPAVTIPTIMSISHGHVDTSLSASAQAMFSTLGEETGSGSGLTATTSPLLRMITDS
jgi:hypothetical protein